MITTELYASFNAWMDSHGHHRWSQELFGSRFRGHTETTRYHVVERRPRDLNHLLVSHAAGPTASLPARPRVYVGVRFLVAGDIDGHTSEDEVRSTRSDHADTPHDTRDSATDGTRVDRVDPVCCDGGPLQLRCKLCPQSPTYWRRADAAGASPSRS